MRSLREIVRRLAPPRTPGVLAPEYGAAVPVELSLANVAGASLQSRRRA